MGADNPPAPGTPWDVMKAAAAYIPTFMQQVGNQLPNVASGQLNAINRLYNPTNGGEGLNALNLEQMQRYAVPEAQVGQAVSESNALAGANTNLKQMLGPGGASALAAGGLEEILNPAYRGANKLIDSINPSGLSPGEANAVERSLNQNNTSTGNLGLLNPFNTISNAMNFGGAYNNKLGILSNAVTSSANGMNNFSPVNVALGQPNVSTQSNFGSGQFSNANPAATNTNTAGAFGLSGGVLGNLTSGNNAMIASQTSLANNQSIPSYLNSTLGNL